MEVISDISMDTPVAPPSIKWLDNKNPLRPKAADKIPSPIFAESLIVLIAFMPKYSFLELKAGIIRMNRQKQSSRNRKQYSAKPFLGKELS